MAAGIFVTGTDTGVGKTLIACGLAAALRSTGARVAVMKPVETGCSVAADGSLIAADAELLRYYADSAAPADRVCPIRLQAPLAPKVAAEREGRQLDSAEILSAFKSLEAAADVVVVEGAGGLLVPISGRETMADLALALALPLVVVVGSVLGALNHTLLTIECARARGLTVCGYVVNLLAPEPDLAAQTNVDELRDWLGPPLAVVPYVEGGARAEPQRRRDMARLFVQCFDLKAILRR